MESLSNSIDLDDSLALAPVNENLICNICFLILDKPRECEGCHHTFCESCITKWLKYHHTCPIDRRIVFKLGTASRCIRRLLSEVQMNCKYVYNGCTETLTVKNFKEHVAHCTYSPDCKLKCQNGCELTIKRFELPTHNCMAELFERIVEQQHLLFNKTAAPIVPNGTVSVLKTELLRIDEFKQMKFNINNEYSQEIIVATTHNQLQLNSWLQSLRRTKVALWSGLQATPTTKVQNEIQSILSRAHCPKNVLTNLMRNSVEKNWPKGINAIYNRLENRYKLKQYNCRKIPLKNAVVVMYHENMHMPADFIKYPGMIFTFHRLY